VRIFEKAEPRKRRTHCPRPIARQIARVRGWLQRHPYIADHPAIVAIALTGGLASPILAAFPSLENGSSLAAEVPSALVAIWLILYAVGSWLLVWAMWRRRPDLEVASCFLLSWVIGLDAIALFSHRGVGAFLVNMIIGGAALGFLARAIVVMILYPERREDPAARDPADPGERRQGPIGAN
jgi:hypothetical protein